MKWTKKLYNLNRIKGMKQGHNQKYKENVVDSISGIMTKTKDHYSWSSNIEIISNEKKSIHSTTI